MDIKFFLFTIAVSLLSSTVMAKKGTPTVHDHNGVSHSHIVPMADLSHERNKTAKPEPSEGWEFLFESKSGIKSYFKIDSFSSGEKSSGVVIKLIYPEESKVNSGTLLRFATIRKEYCKKGFGSLSLVDMTRQMEAEVYPYAFNSGAFASDIGQAICTMAD